MQTLTIGRNHGNTIVLNNPSVSRNHCQITQSGYGTYTISDLGSTNGTFVNGRRIYGSAPLQLGDQVMVGNAPVQWQGYFTGDTIPQGSYSSGTIPQGGYSGGTYPVYSGGYQGAAPSNNGGSDDSLGLILGLSGGGFLVLIVLILAIAGVFKPKEPVTPFIPNNTSGVYTNVPGQYSTPAPQDQVQIIPQPKEPDPEFAGYWQYYDDDMYFYLELYVNGNSIRGTYYGNADYGNYQDYCSSNIIEGTFDGDVAVVYFRSGAKGGGGKATLTYNNGKLIWKLKSSYGSFIAPNKATLKKSKKVL